MAENRIERELDWDDFIEYDSPEFILLPEGDYDFTVNEFKMGRFEGSAKLPPCKKAILTLEIEAPEGRATITHNLFLHTKTEGLICAFFCSIGARKKGEKMQMNWNKVIGATGRCKVGVHSYVKKDGNEGSSNDIQKFYPKETIEPKAEPLRHYTPGQF